MARVSAFLAESDIPLSRYKREFRFYILFGASLSLCGVILLCVPAIRVALVPFLASWLLFIAAILALIRPAMYGRGLPDGAVGLINAFFYGFIGYIAGGTNAMDIEGYKLIISIILLFAGLARLLVFARMISVTVLPMQLICFAADTLSTALLLWGFPDNKPSVIYWYAGLILLIDAAESFSESFTLNRLFETR